MDKTYENFLKDIEKAFTSEDALNILDEIEQSNIDQSDLNKLLSLVLKKFTLTQKLFETAYDFCYGFNTIKLLSKAIKENLETEKVLVEIVKLIDQEDNYWNPIILDCIDTIRTGSDDITNIYNIYFCKNEKVCDYIKYHINTDFKDVKKSYYAAFKYGINKLSSKELFDLYVQIINVKTGFLSDSIKIKEIQQRIARLFANSILNKNKKIKFLKEVSKLDFTKHLIDDYLVTLDIEPKTKEEWIDLGFPLKYHFELTKEEFLENLRYLHSGYSQLGWHLNKFGFDQDIYDKLEFYFKTNLNLLNNYYSKYFDLKDLQQKHNYSTSCFEEEKNFFQNNVCSKKAFLGELALHNNILCKEEVFNFIKENFNKQDYELIEKTINHVLENIKHTKETKEFLLSIVNLFKEGTSKMSGMDWLKKNMEEGVYQGLATSTVENLSKAIVFALQKSGMDEFSVKMTEDFLKSNAGKAVLSLAIGSGIHFVPLEEIQKNDKIQKVADKCAENSAATGIVEITNLATKFILPAIQEALMPLANKNTTAMQALAATGAKFRVEDKQESKLDSKQEETDLLHAISEVSEKVQKAK